MRCRCSNEELHAVVIFGDLVHNIPQLLVSFVYTTLLSQLLHIPNLFCSGNLLLLDKLMGNLLLVFQMFLEHQIPLSLNPGILAHELVHAPNCWARGLLARTRASGACAACSLVATDANWGLNIKVLRWLLLFLVHSDTFSRNK